MKENPKVEHQMDPNKKMSTKTNEKSVAVAVAEEHNEY